MLNIRGKKAKNIEKDVYRLLKEKRLNNNFTTIVNLKEEYIVPEDSTILISTYAGSNEGWYVSITSLEVKSTITYTDILSFRILDSIESAIAIQTELVRNIQL